MNPPRKRAATKRSPAQTTVAEFVSWGVHETFEGSQTSDHVKTREQYAAAGSSGKTVPIPPDEW